MRQLHKKSQRITELWGLVIMFAAFVSAMTYLERLSLSTSLDFSLDTDRKTEVKVYWRKDQEPYSEKRSSSVAVIPEKKNYSISLPPFVDYEYLRIDMGGRKTIAVMSDLRLTSNRSEPRELLPLVIEGKTENTHQLAITRDPAGSVAVLAGQGDDPHFQLRIVPAIDVHYGGVVHLTSLAFFVFFFGYLFSQDRLKGHKHGLQVTVVFDRKRYLNLKGVPSFSEKVTGAAVLTIHGESVAYNFSIAEVDQARHGKLLEILRKNNPGAQIHLQYNRSGEV